MKQVRNFVIALAFAVFLPGQALAEPVDLELVLAVDVSGSVDSSEYTAQKTGYIEAFKNPGIHDSIANGAIGSIAVTYMEWSAEWSGSEWVDAQSQLVGWTKISSAAESTAFADAIAATSRAYDGLTGIAGAIDWSVDAFANDNGYEGTRQVVDISGDGIENVCSPEPACLQDSRDAAVGDGIVINGVAIGGTSLTDYYEANVTGGDGSFVKTAATFEDFEEVMLEKLKTEINPVPAPATLGLMGIGLLGLVAGWRRRRTV